MKIKTENLSMEEIRHTRHRIVDTLKRADLNWTVRGEKLKTENTGVYLNNKQAIIRNDTNKILGIQNYDYEIFQNHEMLEILFQLSRELKYEKGGMFDNGAQTYFQFKTDDLKLTTANGKKDTIKGLITFLNSFDSTNILAMGETNVTISCKNTFVQAYEEIEHKIKHTKGIRNKLNIILYEMDKTIEQEKQTFERIKKLSEIENDPKIQDNVVKMLLNIKSKDFYVNELSHTNYIKFANIMTNIEKELNDKGNTLWGLFSGVTSYTTHDIKKNVKQKDKYFGMIANKDKKAWGMINEFAS